MANDANVVPVAVSAGALSSCIHLDIFFFFFNNYVVPQVTDVYKLSE